MVYLAVNLVVMSYSFFSATVLDIVDETPHVKRYFIRVDETEDFVFKAGQFVMLDLPIDSKVHTRSYSIASAPATNNVFELCIVLKPDGLGTSYLFNHVKVGSTLQVSKPIGKFSLPDPIDRDLCFICTGTGIAPLRSMLLDMLQTQKPHQHIYLVYGNRLEQDILYRQELEDLQQTLSQFTFIPVLSRDNNWEGEKGYVHAIYQQLFAQRQPAYFYICGWADMLKEARHRLEEMGYDKSFIKFESYE